MVAPNNIKLAVLTVLVTSLVFTLSGCGGSSSGGNESTLVPPAPATDRYTLANGCYALKSRTANAFVARDGDSAYHADPQAGPVTEPFFLKPTALGKYLLYRKDAQFIAASGDGVGTVSSASDTADWTIDMIVGGAFTLDSEVAGKRIAVDAASGRLTLANVANAGERAHFDFVPTTGCMSFPEVTVNAIGESFKGRGINQPVLGIADAHTHVSATHYDGGIHYGAPFHRFGVEHALGNCESAHGPDGRFDVIGNFLITDPLAMHDTQGWPTFIDWPKRDTYTHELTYYKWIERARRAGLRLMVNNLVENETLCVIVRNSKGDPQPPPGPTGGAACNEMDSAVRQVYFMRTLEAYVDAQEGGPGKGWLRIVTSPAQARRVINDGKLAVILGIETSHLFNCGIWRMLGVEQTTCSEAQIDEQLDRLYDLGVRAAYPLHEFDNALGGNGLINGDILNLGNRFDTGEFWKTYTCPSVEYWSEAGISPVGTLPAGFGNDPISQALLAASGGILPVYDGSGLQCNARTITPLGEYAIQRLMARKFIVETDHMELTVKEKTIEMAEAQTPKYPLVSDHGAQGGTTMDQARRIIALGGLIYPYMHSSRDYVGDVQRTRALIPAGQLFGVGFGSDAHGLANLPSARGAASNGPVTYPFTLFSGPGWGPEFTGLDPVTFDRQVSGERTYSSDESGMAHYGLMSDWVEEVRIEGGEEAIRALFNSAEVYLRMWERVCTRETGDTGCE